MDLINLIISHLLKTEYRDLSRQTVEVIKRSIIDTLGVAIAGSSAESIEALVNIVKNWDGSKESTILTYGGMVPAHHAALVNCTMARAVDLDAIHEAGGGHLDATFVPTAFVFSEYISKYTGKFITGRELILAIALGSDLSARLRCALKIYPGWISETFAPFGVVAMGGKLLGFNEEKMINGMGLAYSQCSTNLQANIDGAIAVRLQQGIGAQSGCLSTILAEKGFTGAKNVLQGVYGFYPLYGRNEYDPDVITGQLGKRFEIINNSIKPFPSCGFTHIPIYATLELCKEHNINHLEISRLVIYTNSKAYNLCALGKNKYQPQNQVDAQFSIPYTVARAAVTKKVTLDHFTEESIKNREVLALAQKVYVTVDPELDNVSGLIVPNTVICEMRDRKRYSKYIDSLKGHPKNPMSIDECIEKFYECVHFSVRPFAHDKLAEILELINHLEEVNDVSIIPKLLVAGKKDFS